MPICSHRLSAWCICWCVGLLLVTAAPFAHAQAPAADKMTREQERMASDFARGRIPTSEEAKQALQLKIKLEMERLKFPPPRNFEEALALSKLAEIRANIDAIWLTGAKNPEARKVAVQAVAVVGRQLLSENVSPQSKINCMAMLAELDEAPATGTAPPTPSGDAFNVLFQYAGNEQAPIYLRAIALHGINRHLGRWWPTTKWNDNAKSLIAKMLTTIVNSEPASPLDLRAHAWMVSRAYDCLSTMESPLGAKSALDRLADPQALPSLRLSALQYLSRIDTSGFPEDKKALHLIGLAHFARSQLVNWYEKEDDRLKAKSGAAAGGMGGGYASMMGGMEDMMGAMMGGGDRGGDISGMDGDYEGMMGGAMGAYGGLGGRNNSKPVDTQPWQVRLSRRMINQLSQAVHVALDGIPLPEESPLQGVKPIADANLPGESQAKIAKLVQAIEAFQTAVNDPQRVTTMTTLLTQAERNIEDIMDLVKEVPGFLERYPELTPDDELETAEDPDAVPADVPADGVNPDDPNLPNSADPAEEAPATEQPATDEPAGTTPADDATASNP